MGDGPYRRNAHDTFELPPGEYTVVSMADLVEANELKGKLYGARWSRSEHSKVVIAKVKAAAGLPKPSVHVKLPALELSTEGGLPQLGFPVQLVDPLDFDAPIDVRLKMARAARELNRLREARLAVEAADQGLSQRAIAKALDRSQTDVFRMLKAARSGDDITDTSVRERVLQYAAGEITRDVLVDLLVDLERGKAEGGDLVDGYSHGSFDDVKTAWLEGLIDDDLYEEIHRNNSPEPRERQ